MQSISGKTGKRQTVPREKSNPQKCLLTLNNVSFQILRSHPICEIAHESFYIK